MSVIGTNIVALRAQNARRMATADVQRAMERLSTGRRINSAADDPAGFGISEGMSSQISGMAQAIRNAQDGIGLAQTAEGALASVTTMAQRIRELAVNSASGTYSDADRANMDAEAKQLSAQMLKTLQDARFNGGALFDTSPIGSGPGTPGTPGYGTSRPLQVGPSPGDTMPLVIDNIDMSWESSANIGTAPGATAMISTMDGFLGRLSAVRAGVGAQQTGLEATISNLGTSMTNLTEARSRILDTDYAAESMALARAQILVQSSTAMLAQANQMPKIVLDLIR